MKTGDFYTHYKGNEYYFDCIALPLEGRKNVRRTSLARYHEDTHDIQLYICDNGVTYIDSKLPHVIYQAEKDYDTNKVYAREVDDFFGFVSINETTVKRRFALKK